MLKSSTIIFGLFAVIITVVMAGIHIFPMITDNAKSERQTFGRETTEKLYNMGD